MQQRRNSFCTQYQTTIIDDSLISRSTSFTVDTNREISATQEGVKILQGYPLKVDEASPRRTSRFHFPGSKLLKAGFRGFRRNKKSTDLKGSCPWDDTLKGDRNDADSARIVSYKGDSSHEKLPFIECGNSQEAFDIFPEEGVLSLPLSDASQPTVFTLSRLSEANCYEESSVGTPAASTARTNSTRRTSRVRSSVSSFNQGTPEADLSSRLDSCLAWDKMQDTRIKQSRHSQQLTQFSNSTEGVECFNSGKERFSEPNSDKILHHHHRLRTQSGSKMDSANSQTISSFLTTSSEESSSAPEFKPSKKTLDFRTSELSKKEQLQILTTSKKSEFTRKSKSGMNSLALSSRLKSSRSDHVFLHQCSQGRRKLDVGTTRRISSCSERNLCTERIPDAISSAAVVENSSTSITNIHDDDDLLRSMKSRESQLVLNPSSRSMAETLSIQTSLEDEVNKDPPFPKEELASVIDDSLHWDNNECNSVLEDPKSIAMWFDWLEERSDITRKEILYRMKCQKAFIQEANENLSRTDIMIDDEYSNITNPKLKDRLRSLKKRYIAKSVRSSNFAEEINDDEIVDIGLDELDVFTERKTKQNLHLKI
eukprot:g4820.t1